jgi:hypothetical protein
MGTITVGDLRRDIQGLPDDIKLYLEGGLTFSRLKRWADDEFIICFNEVLAELSPSFRKKHPEILSAFGKVEPAGDEHIDVAYVLRV